MINNKFHWIPPLDRQYHSIDSHSWFDINETVRNPNHDTQQYCMFGNGKIIIRSRPNRLYPTPEQATIIQKWIKLTRMMYNCTVKFLNSKIFVKGKVDAKRVKEYVNFFRLRNIHLKSQKTELTRYNINIHLLDQAIHRCVTMFKSCLTKYKKGTLKEFRIRPIKPSKRYHSFDIEKILFSQKTNGFCVSVLGNIKSEYPIKPDSGCVLQYDKYTSKYVLHMPKKYKVSDNVVDYLIAGADPGIRTFLTVYSKGNVMEFCKNANYDKYFNKIDKLNTYYGVNEENKNNQSRKYKKAIGKIYDKIHNLSKDMHFKIAKELCMRYKKIKIGNFSTSRIVNNVSSNLAKKSKRLLYALSHYKFRERLTHQAEKYGVCVEFVSEYLTTKRCSKCDTINEPKASKVYTCKKCGLEADRDINAAKNIKYV